MKVERVMEERKKKEVNESRKGDGRKERKEINEGKEE